MDILRLRKFVREALRQKTFTQEEILDWALLRFQRNLRSDTRPRQASLLDRLAQERTKPEDWRRPESVGWLYQLLNDAQKTRERQGVIRSISTCLATGLYTPEWIVALLLERGLLPEIQRATTPRELEAVTLLDPACGTGHILLAAYDLFLEAYQKMGLTRKEASETTLKKNLFGFDLDSSALSLAKKLLNLHAGREPANQALHLYDLSRLSVPASFLGSLWIPDPDEPETAPAVFYLKKRYRSVIANPPYAGWKGMNETLKRYVREKNFVGRGNLATLFMERGLLFTEPNGSMAMVTPQSWMFLSTFDPFRQKLLAEFSLEWVAHLGTGAFPAIGGEVVAAAVSLFRNRKPHSRKKPLFIRLLAPRIEEKEAILRSDQERYQFYKQSDFSRFPHSVLCYHLPPRIGKELIDGPRLGDCFEIAQGMATGDNRRFLRRWDEAPHEDCGFDCTSLEEAERSEKRWFPYTKGEGRRRWQSLWTDLVNWSNRGEEIRQTIPKAVIRNADHFFEEGLSWSYVGTGPFAVRYRTAGSIFDVGASSIFLRRDSSGIPLFCCAGKQTFSGRDLLFLALGYLNSSFVGTLIEALNPTVSCQVGDLAALPFDFEKIVPRAEEILSTVRELIQLSDLTYRQTLKRPRTRQETILLQELGPPPTLAWEEIPTRIHRLEETNHQIFQEIFCR